MIAFESGPWRWHVSGADDLQALGSSPEELISRAREIRNTGGKRIVYAGDGYFFKWERPTPNWRERLFPRAKAEFRTLRKLSELGFPTVRPAAYGVNGTESILITRAARGTVTIREYLNRRTERGEALPEPFADKWMEILGHLIRSHLYIPDFHCSNLLYAEAENAFFIVDPPGTKRMIFPRPDRVLRMLKRQFAPLLDYLTDEAFVAILSRISAEPERLFRKILEYNARFVRRSQLHHGKRLRDFRRGRFTVNIDGKEMRCNADGLPLTADSTEMLRFDPDAAVEMWERDFIFGLHHIPRLRIVGRDLESGALYRERAGGAPVDPARKPQLLERLKIAGISPEGFDFATDAHARTVLVDVKFRSGPADPE